MREALWGTNRNPTTRYDLMMTWGNSGACDVV